MPLPIKYIDNLQNAWGDATHLLIEAGAALGSDNEHDIVLVSQQTLNIAVNGVNGLDTGSPQNNKWYSLFVIGNSNNINSGKTILSLSEVSPVLPSGFNIYRKCGIWRTNGSAQLLQGAILGNSHDRVMFWESPIQVLSSGNATSFTEINLNAAVPPIAKTMFKALVDVEPGLVGNRVQIRRYGSQAAIMPTFTGFLLGNVSPYEGSFLADINGDHSAVEYKTSSALDNVDMYVYSFNFYV